jgi:hypothetical protein
MTFAISIRQEKIFFDCNCHLSVTDLTRRFRILDNHLDAWVDEGILPAPIWINGRRRWSSNQINHLIKGCELTLPKATNKDDKCLQALKVAFLCLSLLVLISKI